MSLATYAGLQAEIAARTRRSDLTAFLPGFISLFEAKAQRALRVRRMMTRTTVTLSSEYLTAPADLVGVRSFEMSTTSPKRQLAYVTPDQMDALIPLNESGNPRYYTIIGSEFRFYPAPSASIAANLIYWQSIPALSDSNTSNWLLATHPDAYVVGGMEQANIYLKQFEVAAGFAASLVAILAEIQRADDEAYGATLTPMPSTALAGYI